MLRASFTFVRLVMRITLDPRRRNPELLEVVQLADSATRVAVYVRAFTDTAAVADAIASRALGKALADSASLTDDVGGQATADDDQTLGFFKALNHTGLAADTARRDGTKALALSALLADSAIRALGRPASDAAAASDALARTVAYSRELGPYAIDYFAENYVDIDAVGAADSLARAAAKALAHGGAAAEAGSLLAQGYTSDPFYFAEDFVGATRTF